jgi:hypothetical protein
MWDNLGNLGRAMEVYKNDILNSKSVNPLLIAYTFSYRITSLQSFLSGMLIEAYKRAAVSSPAFLYSLTLSTGDYRYILVAMSGSISTILGSLAIGLIETKIKTRDLLKYLVEELPLQTSLALTIASAVVAVVALIFTFIPPVALVLNIIALILATLALISWIQTAISYYYEYPYLKKNTYSPKYLLNLVNITKYDLSLLKYEINIWDQLKD